MEIELIVYVWKSAHLTRMEIPSLKNAFMIPMKFLLVRLVISVTLSLKSVCKYALKNMTCMAILIPTNVK
jgi:hypothetical protein